MSKTIGMVSGGQLGRMLTKPAIKAGYKVVVIDPTPDCPAKQVGAEQIVGGYKDSQALLKLASVADYLTIEIEHIDTKTLADIEKTLPVNPSADTISLLQDKYEQKKFLLDNDLPTADFVEIDNAKTAADVLKRWGGHMMLKSKTDAFDGRGNAVITGASQISGIIKRFEGRELYAEKLIDFKKELAVMVAKDIKGNIISYPAVETVHERNICVEVYAPAQISDDTADKALSVAEKVVSKLKGAGVYGVEMFLDENNNILINEIAPRVHNSGHYTMDMCDVSQFEQHILAITGQSLKKPSLTAEYCCMVNILGERDGPVELSGVEEAEKIQGVSVYIYGKGPTKIDRKMGHINATGSTIEQAKANARKARKLINI